MQCSWYQYVCNQGKVPVISCTNNQATWPLNDNYCTTILLLHWPNWRHTEDIKTESLAWTDAFLLFMESPDCPTFIKAEIVKKRHDKSNKDNDGDSITDDETNQPDWMRAVRPNSEYIGDADVLEFDDGGPGPHINGMFRKGTTLETLGNNLYNTYQRYKSMTVAVLTLRSFPSIMVKNWPLIY